MKLCTVKGRRNLLLAFLCLVVFLALTSFYFLMPMSSKADKCYVYVDSDDDIDSVCAKLDTVSHGYSLTAFKILARHLGVSKHVRSGRYALETGMTPIGFVRNMRNGHQEPLRLTTPSVRTIDRLADELGAKLMMSGDELYLALSDSATCAKYGMDTLTVQCLFVPNTYDVYWNISVSDLLARMKKEYDRFWSNERMQKAESLGLSPVEVMTVASIVDEETSNNGEKPMIAGMYLNRLKAGMPLQADPTIKYALKQFELRRIYTNMLDVKSPYNTYRNIGLPPGPIRIPSVAGIDAVLNRVEHKYMYMCAKEDFSGTHNFAVTYAEHLANAKKYSEALNNRGIK